jgi:alpha-beta hydrolase superfamily lysophospholipase
MKEMTVTAGDWRFRVLEEGSRDHRTVLLLHGFPESADEWSAQLGFLARAGFRAVLGGEDGAGIGALFEQQGLSSEAAAAHAAVHQQPRALTAAPNWYRHLRAY